MYGSALNTVRLYDAGIDAENHEQNQAYRQTDSPAQGFHGSVALALVDHHVIQAGTQVV